MKSIQQLQEADLHQCLQHKIGEQLRAMYADEAYRKLPARLLDLLRDFEQVETKVSPAGLKEIDSWRRT
jgi:hypothetical protein